jgi:hypothetical protein
MSPHPACHIYLPHHLDRVSEHSIQICLALAQLGTKTHMSVILGQAKLAATAACQLQCSAHWFIALLPISKIL